MDIKIALTKTYLSSLGKLPKGTQKKANELLDKFRENPDAAAINYEKISNMRDDKVRTARIDQKYRAIIIHPKEGNVYMFMYADNHDEAMDWAKNKFFSINDKTNAIQVVDEAYIKNSELAEDHDNLSIQGSIIDEYDEDELLSLGVPRIVLPILPLIGTFEDLNKKLHGYISEDIFDILSCCVEKIPLNEIKECFSINSSGSKESFYDALNCDINKNYVKVVSEEEEIASILDNPIDFWRVFIHPRQMQYVIGNRGNYKGSFQLKGAAGTGKTVVAMHRAKYLIENVYTDEQDKILYTTFSTKLTSSVENNLKNMCSLKDLRRIQIVNLHSWLSRYLRRHGVEFNIVSSDEKKRYISEAMVRTSTDIKASVADIIREIDQVLAYNQIIDLNSYLKVSRKGLKKALGKNQRIDMWSVIEQYFIILSENQATEWWLIRKKAIDIIKINNDVNYQAIIVDEAQDFGMAEYRLLRAMIPEKENDLFVVGDIRQRIYSAVCNYSKCRINIMGNRTKTLMINYRNTYEIGLFADKVLLGKEFLDFNEEIIQHSKSSCIIHGNEPVTKEFSTKEQEVRYVVDEIEKIVKAGMIPNEIAIISRTKKGLQPILDGLMSESIDHLQLNEYENVRSKSVYCGTMHAIKGFEFKVVFLVGASKHNIPLNYRMQECDDEDDYQKAEIMERSLLYVGLTRARDMLYVTSCGAMTEWLK